EPLEGFMRPYWLIALVTAMSCSLRPPAPGAEAEAPLHAGFAEMDITPTVGEKEKPVYMAGFGQNRKATGVHDPLLARVVVLKQGDRKIALVSVDLVGFFYPSVARIREQLKDYHYVLVSS